MRAGWLKKNLIEVCDEITDGSHFSPKSSSNESYPYITVRDIVGEAIDFENCKFINEEDFKQLVKNGCKPNEGDLLFSKDGTVGKVALVNYRKDFVVLSSLAIIRPMKGLIDSNLLKYILLNPSFIQIAIGKKTGVAIRRIILKNLKQIEIQFPKSLSEQKQIVAILDKAFAVIDQAKANIERNIENAKELFQSKLNEIFSQKGEGWEEKKLGELGILTSSKRIFKKEYVNSGIPFYRSKEIKELAHNKEITLELFITKERYSEIKSQSGIPQAGDILLTAVGTIGEMYVVKEDEEFYFKDGNIMWLKDFKSLNTYYLKYALTSYVEQLKAMSRGAAYSALTIEKLKQYRVPVPPQNQQANIVYELNTLLRYVNDSASKYQQKLVLLDELKKSILQKAFAGELTGKAVTTSLQTEMENIAAEPGMDYNSR